MLTRATYSNGTQAATVHLERTDVLLKSENEILCFPRLIELEGDRLVLVYLKKWHELVCASGRGFYGTPQVTHIMLSLDGTGERWEYPFAFHTGPGCSYTSVMERDGKLYVTYSDSDVATPFGGGGNCPIGTYGLPYQSIKRAVLKIETHAPNPSDPVAEPATQGGAGPLPDKDGFNDSLRY